MATPAEVAASLEQLAAEARQQALANLSFAAATLNLLVEAMRWTPDDEPSIAAAVEGFQARSNDGLSALGDMQNYRRALANVRELEAGSKTETVTDLTVPTDRTAKLDELTSGMIETAAVASSDLETLTAILRNGGPGAAEALCERMASFTARAQELETIYRTAGEVAACAASA